MKKLLVLVLILGSVSAVRAVPIITGPDADGDGLLDLDITAGTVTLTLEGTADEATGGGGSPAGGYKGWIWVDYSAYKGQLSNVVNISLPGVGIDDPIDRTGLPDYFGFTAQSKIPWSEDTDIDEGAWLSFDLSTLAGANVGDTYSVDFLDTGFALVSSTVVEVVPEPMTIALLGVGGLVLLRKRRA